MSNVMEATSSPDEAGWFFRFGFNTDTFVGLDSTLKYEKSRYNNANVFLPNTPIIIKIEYNNSPLNTCQLRFNEYLSEFLFSSKLRTLATMVLLASDFVVNKVSLHHICFVALTNNYRSGNNGAIQNTSLPDIDLQSHLLPVIKTQLCLIKEILPTFGIPDNS
ncbi:unnamed protein product [Schistosoma mattheei]|uniref:Uncharacterized protein n=1 Tax=Schistosoma mattheei TaxID=31246 RepID=A0A183NVG3_9TREM|nr:unnamed protein product [Schistosoma mattheei]